MQSILKFTLTLIIHVHCRSHILMSTPCHALFVCTIHARGDIKSGLNCIAKHNKHNCNRNSASYINNMNTV